VGITPQEDLISFVMPELKAIPKLLYIGDVPVEASFHGSILLYRLLQEYPPDRLFIIERGQASLPGRRLPGVKYGFIPRKTLHPQMTRFELLTAGIGEAGELTRVLKEAGADGVDGILTVAHGTGWMSAYRLANRLRLPLHVICHDDHVRSISRWPVLRQWGEFSFSRMYAAAKSRFCVCHGMEQEYYRRYGKKGTVLYPNRDKNPPAAVAPPDRLRSETKQITAAYAGSLHMVECENALITLGRILGKCGGRLIVYGNYPDSVLSADKIGDAPIEVRRPLSSSELIKELRETADFLFVPLPFSPSDSIFVRTSFPSKLTDYTCVGIPMLFYAPEDSSLMQWAAQSGEAALCITSNSPVEMESAVNRLLLEPTLRWQLAQRSIEAGAKDFNYENAKNTFFKGLHNFDSPSLNGRA
jgi:hypothetical protein